MTEAEWLASEDPQAMLERHHRAPDRKLRLFACACCRLAWDCVPLGYHRRLVDVCEQFVDGGVGAGIIDLVRRRAQSEQPPRDGIAQAPDAALATVHPIAWVAARDALRTITTATCKRAVITASVNKPDLSSPVSVAAVQAWQEDWTRSEAWSTSGKVPWNDRHREAAQAAEQIAHLTARRLFASALRCVFFSTFRLVELDPTFRTVTVVAIARQMYASRDFSAMPILADALQEEGCDSDDVLSHCRGPGPHARGCWVVDRVLGKE